MTPFWTAFKMRESVAGLSDGYEAFYLEGHFVETADGPTSQHYVSRGVPQGSVLSPTLFSLSLVGLTEALPTTVHISIYADDICIWTSGVSRPQIRARLQKAATLTCLFLRKRGLEISPEKCALVAFTRKTMSHYGISLNGHSISYVKSHRFLGVIIDRDLSWTTQISSLKKRLIAVVHLFKFLAGKTWGVSVRSMLHLYNALFLGVLRYSLPVLSNTCKTNLRTIQAIQAQGLRTCLGLPRCASTVATICIARDHPITTYVAVDTLRAHIRHLARLPHHHLASVPSTRPRASFCKVVTAYSGSLPSRYTPAARPSSPLWCMLQPQVCLTIPGIKRKLIFHHEVFSNYLYYSCMKPTETGFMSTRMAR